MAAVLRSWLGNQTGHPVFVPLSRRRAALLPNAAYALPPPEVALESAHPAVHTQARMYLGRPQVNIRNEGVRLCRGMHVIHDGSTTTP